VFAIHCPRHGSRVMLTLDAVDSMTRHNGCLALTYTCTCGHRGQWHSRADRHEETTTV
jgi:hypothetical protein